MKKLLTKKEEKILEQLRILLEFGSEIFIKYLQTSIGDGNYKKSFISFYFGAIHNYTESIYILCKNSRPHSATVLMRSVFEAFINVLYLTNTNSNLKIAKYTISDFEERIKVINQFKRFVAKYPDWENKYQMTNLKNLDSLIDRNKKHKEAIERGNKFYKTTTIESDLRKRAEAYDKKVKGNGVWEFNYILIYKYFSTYTHLTVTGIENFVKQEDDKTLFDIGQSEGVKEHLITTYSIYIALLYNIKKRKFIPGNIDLNKFIRQLKQMQKE